MSKKNAILLGAHISTAGGFEKAIERGASIGCTTIQIFTKSNRQWGARAITQDEIDLFKNAQKSYNMHDIVAHASYLINIGSPKKDIEKKSIEALVVELERCEMLGIGYLVLHPGSYLDSDETECLERIANNLSHVFTKVPGNTMILLESMAGQGSSTCYTFEQLAYVLKKVKPKSRIGVCIDTCHVFVAGYDFRTPATYKKMWHDFDTIIGRNHLKAIHLNDSKKECGSRVDRHESIGKGKIGLEGFDLFMNDTSLASIPKIIETPVKTTKGWLTDHKKNIDILKDLI